MKFHRTGQRTKLKREMVAFLSVCVCPLKLHCLPTPSHKDNPTHHHIAFFVSSFFASGPGVLAANGTVGSEPPPRPRGGVLYMLTPFRSSGSSSKSRFKASQHVRSRSGLDSRGEGVKTSHFRNGPESIVAFLR